MEMKCDQVNILQSTHILPGNKEAHEIEKEELWQHLRIC